MTTHLGKYGFWKRELSGFFDWCAPRLQQVVDAAGVRELWLQGEAFRYFRHERDAGSLPVWVNCHKRNDLVCFDSPADTAVPMMIAELKLYGLEGYFSKNLTGYSDLHPYVQPRSARQRFVFQPEHAAQCNPREGSILKDYQKLLKRRAEDDCLCLLVLVLDTRRTPDGFGGAIQQVDFGGPSKVLFRSDDLLVKLWQIG